MVSTIDRPHVSPTIAVRLGWPVIHKFPRWYFLPALDWMAIAWQEDALRAVAFGHPSRRQAAVALARSPWMPTQFSRLLGENQLAEAPDWVRDVVARLRLFAEGEPVDFSNVPLALEHLSPFARRVVAACRRIGWGQVSTYGDLAAAMWLAGRRACRRQRDGQELLSADRAMPSRARRRRHTGRLFRARRAADEKAIACHGRRDSRRLAVACAE